MFITTKTGWLCIILVVIGSLLAITVDKYIYMKILGVVLFLI
jgi:hypothetical protein